MSPRGTARCSPAWRSRISRSFPRAPHSARRSSCRRARSCRCPPSSRRCSPKRATPRSTAPTGCGSPSSTAIACSRSSTSTASSSARGAGSICRRSFRALVAELGKQAVNGMILDGEIVAFGASGKPSFAALQDRAQLKTEREIAAADETTPWPSMLRPAVFRGHRPARFAVSRSAPLPRAVPAALAAVQLVHAADDGLALQAAALASGFEGVVGKRKESRYEAGRRSTSWLKVKPTQSADFVIGGYTQGKGSRAPLGAILVGYWEGASGGQAPLRVARGVGLRRAHARAGQGAPWPAASQTVRSRRRRS